MDFQKASREPDSHKRDGLIEKELYEHSWYDELEDGCGHGGFVDDAYIDDIQIQDSDDEIKVTFGVQFVESVRSSCKDYNHEYPRYANFTLTIDKDTGHYELDEPDFDEDGLVPGDYT